VVSRMPCRLLGWLPSDETVSLVSSAVAWLETGTATPHQECRRGVPFLVEDVVFIIGIDPHKGSHTGAVIDGDETVVAQLSLRADRRQRDSLLRFAAPFSSRPWAGGRREWGR